MLYVYRACSIPLMQKTIANSIMYGVYSKERSRLGDSGQLSARKACLLACTYAGGIEALVCSPLERCQSVLQDRRNDTKFRGLRDVVLWQSQRGTMMKSIRSLYTGLSLIWKCIKIIWRGALDAMSSNSQALDRSASRAAIQELRSRGCFPGAERDRACALGPAL